jgi:hypothetical protein
MTDSAEGPAPGNEGASGATSDDQGRGRLLDAAAVGALILLVVIIADIRTDGRLITRRLLNRPAQEGDPGDNPAE